MASAYCVHMYTDENIVRGLITVAVVLFFIAKTKNKPPYHAAAHLVITAAHTHQLLHIKAIE